MQIQVEFWVMMTEIGTNKGSVYKGMDEAWKFEKETYLRGS